MNFIWTFKKLIRFSFKFNLFLCLNVTLKYFRIRFARIIFNFFFVKPRLGHSLVMNENILSFENILRKAYKNITSFWCRVRLGVVALYQKLTWVSIAAHCDATGKRSPCTDHVPPNQKARSWSEQGSHI